METRPSRNLYVNYYKDSDKDRQAEVDACMQKNLDSEYIDKIYLVLDSDVDTGWIELNEKVCKVRLNRRPTYSDYFSLINLYSGEEDLNIIANSDIYFDRTLEYCDFVSMDRRCFALSRWDVMPNGAEPQLHNHLDSQDVWIFRGKIRTYIHGEFNLGKRGCDNRILHEIRQTGYKVVNPSKLIKTYHLHLAQKRSYSMEGKEDLIPPPYDFARPSGVDELFPNKKILHVALNDFGRQQMGLRNMLASLGEYHEFDWIKEQGYGLQQMKDKLVQLAIEINPDFTFIQTQNPEIVTPDMARQMPGFKMNWTGDVRLPVPEWYYDLGTVIGVTCFSNMHDVEALRKEGIRAEFMQIGVDESLFADYGPGTECPEVVFMANHYQDKFPLTRLRHQIVLSMMARYGAIFGLYGAGWTNVSVAENLIGKEAEEAKIYRSCKIAINCSHFNYRRYSSDRLLRIMSCGAFCLTHRYEGLQEDFTEGVHLEAWSTFDELFEKTDYYLKHDRERNKIAKAGCREVRDKHTWMARAAEVKSLTNEALKWDEYKKNQDELRRIEEMVGGVASL